MIARARARASVCVRACVWFVVCVCLYACVWVCVRAVCARACVTLNTMARGVSSQDPTLSTPSVSRPREAIPVPAAAVNARTQEAANEPLPYKKLPRSYQEAPCPAAVNARTQEATNNQRLNGAQRAPVLQPKSERRSSCRPQVYFQGVSEAINSERGSTARGDQQREGILVPAVSLQPDAASPAGACVMVTPFTRLVYAVSLRG